VAAYYEDPLGFVHFAYPWGEPGGPLERFRGPDRWQVEILEEIGEEVALSGFDGLHPVAPIRQAIASGHGTPGAGRNGGGSWKVSAKWLSGDCGNVKP
jgi:hypothetical protein